MSLYLAAWFCTSLKIISIHTPFSGPGLIAAVLLQINMTSILASQLTQIRVKSSNSLDLKAQKKAHSQSLLFEPQIAAIKEFDTLYQICYEGFIELCQLDSRFADFSRSIFSEQSKLEDRTLLTEAQNKRLDSILESFLGLVGSRLLLKPALQAVEWIVRRFR